MWPVPFAPPAAGSSIARTNGVFNPGAVNCAKLIGAPGFSARIFTISFCWAAVFRPSGNVGERSSRGFRPGNGTPIFSKSSSAGFDGFAGAWARMTRGKANVRSAAAIRTRGDKMRRCVRGRVCIGVTFQNGAGRTATAHPHPSPLPFKGEGERGQTSPPQPGGSRDHLAAGCGAAGIAGLRGLRTLRRTVRTSPSVSAMIFGRSRLLPLNQAEVGSS